MKRKGVEGATLEEHQTGKRMTKGGLQLKRLLSNGCHLFQLYHPLKATHALNKADVLELYFFFHYIFTQMDAAKCSEIP